MLEKPSELVLFRKVEQGGLGLHNTKYKALASLISTFLQTAANKNFQQSLYHSCLYRYYCLGDDSLEKPMMPPYYNQTFFDTIKKVVEDTPLNPIYMTVKQWYDFLIEEVTMETVDMEGRQIPRKCRVELSYPDNDWAQSFHFSRLRGLSMEARSFSFKLLHQILPFNERLNQLLPNTNPECSLCHSQQAETPLHALFLCQFNSQAATALLNLTRPYAANISAEKALLFDVAVVDTIYELPTMLVLATGMHFIWKNRCNKKRTELYHIRSELECLVSLLRRSRPRLLREAGNMVNNSLANFPI